MPPTVKPETESPENSSLPEVPEKFAPGELVASDGEPTYGFRNERLPAHYQEVARGMVQKIAQIDIFAQDRGSQTRGRRALLLALDVRRLFR